MADPPIKTTRLALRAHSSLDSTEEDLTDFPNQDGIATSLLPLERNAISKSACSCCNAGHFFDLSGSRFVLPPRIDSNVDDWMGEMEHVAPQVVDDKRSRRPSSIDELPGTSMLPVDPDRTPHSAKCQPGSRPLSRKARERGWFTLSFSASLAGPGLLRSFPTWRQPFKTGTVEGGRGAFCASHGEQKKNALDRNTHQCCRS